MPLERGGLATPAPSTQKVTVPVAALGLTVAVKVTDCPLLEGFGLEASVVVVAVAAVKFFPVIFAPLTLVL
jgi:hypothetical protein